MDLYYACLCEYICIYINRKKLSPETVSWHMHRKLQCFFEDKQFPRRQMKILCLGLCIHKNIYCMYLWDFTYIVMSSDLIAQIIFSLAEVNISNFRDKCKTELMNSFWRLQSQCVHLYQGCIDCGWDQTSWIDWTRSRTVISVAAWCFTV